MATTTPRLPQVGDQWRFKNDVVEVIEFIPALDHFGGVSAVRYAWLTEIDVDPAIREHSSREEGRLTGLARSAEFVRTATLVVAVPTDATGVDTYDSPEPEPAAREFAPGNPVLVDNGREGRVTSVHDDFVWVSIKDPLVNTGWRPANGYHPSDVKHAPAPQRPFTTGDPVLYSGPTSEIDGKTGVVIGPWTEDESVIDVELEGAGRWSVPTERLALVDPVGALTAPPGVLLAPPPGMTPEARQALADRFAEVSATGHATVLDPAPSDSTPSLVQLDQADAGRRVIAAALAFDELDDRREGLDVAGVDAWDTARERLRQALADFREVNR